MFSGTDIPDERLWVEVGGEVDDAGPFHPYGMHLTVNRPYVEVVAKATDDENHIKRWVLVRDGELEAWVRPVDADQYGSPIQPDERVSAAELEAITLKQRAMQDPETVSVDTARDMIETGTPEQVEHAVIAAYYAAKGDPDISDEDLDRLRELMYESTGHVDTSHVPSLKRALSGVLDEEATPE